jgi:hypothetical protein
MRSSLPFYIILRLVPDPPFANLFPTPHTTGMIYPFLYLLLILPDCLAAPKSVLLRNFPHIELKPDFCGEACAGMVRPSTGSALGRTSV